MPASLA